MKLQQAEEIVYLTGLSIDKKRMHRIFQHICSDPDYLELLKVAAETIGNLKQKPARNTIGRFVEFAEWMQDINKLLGDGITDQIVEVIYETTGLKFFNTTVGFFYSHYTRANTHLQEDTIVAPELLSTFYKGEDVIGRAKQLVPLDLFWLFISNQSDSRGAPALAAVGEQVQGRFALHYGYADGPFYGNEFIDNVSIKLTDNFKSLNHRRFSGNSLLNGLFISEEKSTEAVMIGMAAIYRQHALDIIASRLIASATESKDKHLKSYSDILDHFNEQDRKQFVNALSNRGLFGIDLLSRCLFLLVGLIPNGGPLRVFIEGTDDAKKNYAEELLDTAGDPERVVITDNESEAHIVLAAEVGIPEQRSNKVQSSGFLHFFPEQNGGKHETVFRVPIKLVVSLPLNAKEVPDKKLCLPSRLVPRVEGGGVMNVLTVGGVEHNRPLLHLINAHRIQTGKKRVFGFFDNMFDFVHRANHHSNDGYESLFIMGVNQPVSGFNEILVAREDNLDGESVSRSAKIMYFCVNPDADNNAPIHIVAVYGFSALSSARATLYCISNIHEACSGAMADEFPLARHALGRRGVDNASLYGYAMYIRFCKDADEKLAEITGGLDYFSYVRLDSGRVIQKLFRGHCGDRGGILEPATKPAQRQQ